ncbi:hypothetical protein [Streptomyces sp. NPDC001401]|uniref:hypothetical protein n=1 Tax=Streptomyces sp. NPDC001401 TaxID=3364570 RepID=UPI0036A3FEE5
MMLVSRLTVFALSACQSAERFDQRVGRRAQHGGGVGFSGGRGQRLPHGVADVVEGGVGEPVQVEAEISGQAQALAQAADQHGAVAARPVAPFVVQGGECAGGSAVPVLR